jgi:hypothetical protein
MTIASIALPMVPSALFAKLDTFPQELPVIYAIQQYIIVRTVQSMAKCAIPAIVPSFPQRLTLLALLVRTSFPTANLVSIPHRATDNASNAMPAMSSMPLQPSAINARM